MNMSINGSQKSNEAFWNSIANVWVSMSGKTGAFMLNEGNGSFSVSFFKIGIGGLASSIEHILNTNASYISTDAYGAQQWQGSAGGILHNPFDKFIGYGRRVVYGQQQNGGGDDLGRALSFASFATGLYADYMHNHKTYTTTGGQPRSIYRSNGAYRSARAAQFGQLSKFVRGLGVAGAIVSTGYSANNVYNQYNAGGVGNINPWDATDVGVGVIGLGTTGLVAVGLLSNPVGWVIGAGVTLYFGGRLIYDFVKD